jgi:3-hydroxyisobutyrate dehydrogenase-like beta-hydroxyacid dehydrogenase
VKVGFLGLGTMGAPMAANLARRGHEVVAWNRTRARADALAASDPAIRVADTPAAAARDAEIVFTMLADPPALEAVVAGPEGVLDGARPGTLLVDLSTVDPATIRALAERAAARGVTLLDAPVSGSRKPAVDGTLLLMAGGDARDVERARPALEAMGRVLHVGPRGAGAATKLVLNGLGAHMMVGYAASLVLAARLGLDPERTAQVIQSGAFSSPLYAIKTAKILDRDFAPDFSLALMLKDQDLVLATAAAAGVELPTLEAIRAQVARAVAAGLGELDLCAVVRLFEAQAGVTVRR